MLLQQNLFDSGSYVVTSETSNVASMVVALKNGKLGVFGTDLNEAALDAVGSGGFLEINAHPVPVLSKMEACHPVVVID